MLEALSYEFMRNALAAGLLASVACGIIGTLVVVNRIVFLSGAVAHAAYAGVGLAFYMGWPVLPCTVGVSVGASGLMAAATARGMEKSDRLIGALWAGGMATGVILLDLSPGYNADLMSFLFGSILAVPRADVWLMAGLVAVVLLLTVVFHKQFSAISFDREFAAVRGVPVLLMHFLLLAMIGASVVLIIRVVGLVLVIALLTIPPGLALPASRSLGGMMLRSTLYCALFCTAGLGLSYRLDLTSGASIIAVAVAWYFVSAAWRTMRARGEES